MALCGNVESVPVREFVSLECVADCILLQMREEMRAEVARLKKHLRRCAAARNGLDAVELECSLRELAEHRLSLKSPLWNPLGVE